MERERSRVRDRALTLPQPPTATSRPWLTVATVLAVLGLALSSLLDQRAADQYQQAFSRALVTFGLARALNGVISVVQGTEVAVEPAGVGVTFTPGELLDPVNDLVERFSWLMLLAGVSLGVQQTLLTMSAWWGTRLLVGLGAAALLGARWLPASSRWRAGALRFFAFALLLRFAMPIIMLATDALYQVFMRAEYEAATQVIEQTRNELELIAEHPDGKAAEEQSWFGSIRSWVDHTAAQVDLGERVDTFRARLSQATEQLLRLAALFVLQTVLLPLATLWLLVKLAQSLLGYRSPRLE